MTTECPLEGPDRSRPLGRYETSPGCVSEIQTDSSAGAGDPDMTSHTVTRSLSTTGGADAGPSPPTATVTSLRVDSAPSLAVARRTYVPACENRAVTDTLPSATRVGPLDSNVTFAGPRICIHATDNPRGRAGPDEFA